MLFGYKSKISKEGLYEIFAPIPDARYILVAAFKKTLRQMKEKRLNTEQVALQEKGAADLNVYSKKVSSSGEPGGDVNF